MLSMLQLHIDAGSIAHLHITWITNNTTHTNILYIISSALYMFTASLKYITYVDAQTKDQPLGIDPPTHAHTHTLRALGFESEASCATALCGRFVLKLAHYVIPPRSKA